MNKKQKLLQLINTNSINSTGLGKFREYLLIPSLPDQLDIVVTYTELACELHATLGIRIKTSMASQIRVDGLQELTQILSKIEPESTVLVNFYQGEGTLYGLYLQENVILGCIAIPDEKS